MVSQSDKLQTVVLRAFLFYRTGLGADRKLYLQTLAIYIAFCIQEDHQSRYGLLESFPHKYNQIILWVHKWSAYTLNGRGEELLYFKNSSYGNNFA